LLLAGVMDEMELRCWLVSWMDWNSKEFHLIHDTSQQQYWLTIPEAVSTVMSS
jgi:hypothetical protein